jgi:hypothetical protein
MRGAFVFRARHEHDGQEYTAHLHFSWRVPRHLPESHRSRRDHANESRGPESRQLSPEFARNFVRPVRTTVPKFASGTAAYMPLISAVLRASRALVHLLVMILIAQVAIAQTVLLLNTMFPLEDPVPFP